MANNPCTRNCSFSEELEICTGCLRTLEELRAWRTMTDEERQSVLDRITSNPDSASETQIPYKTRISIIPEV